MFTAYVESTAVHAVRCIWAEYPSELMPTQAPAAIVPAEVLLLLLLQVAAIRSLVQHGCAVAAVDSVGANALHVAAGAGHLEAMAALVAAVRPPGLPVS